MRFEVNAVGEWEHEPGVFQTMYAVFDSKEGKLVTEAQTYSKASVERDRLTDEKDTLE